MGSTARSILERSVIAGLLGSMLALASLGGGASADETAKHALPPGMRDAACVHCHESPHPVRENGETFGDCASCHATQAWRPSTFGVAEHASLDFTLEGKHVDIGCRQCHAGGQLSGLPDECAGCHIDRHRGILGESCVDCHSINGFVPVEDFEHGKTGFALAGPHEQAACTACHQGENGLKLRQGAGPACETCHAVGHGDFGKACESCHSLEKGKAFDKVVGAKVFDHRITGFDLERRHAAQRCGSCHPAGKPTPDTRCSSCHLSPHMGQLDFQCQDCHRPDRWSLPRFDHDLTGWTLRGAHFTAACASCHTNQRWIGLTTECWDCHAVDASRAPGNVEAHRFGRTDCSDCHSAWSWSL